jgi:hypothetical protein
MKPIAEMDDLEFALFFKAVHAYVMQNPLNNFVKAPGFINFSPTPGQIVLLKNAFGQPLDDETKHSVWVETLDSEGEFDLAKSDFTEVELFNFFTGLDYEYSGKKFNRINLLCGRRAGKSTCASILALFSAIKMNWRPYLKKTPVATIAILSHSVEFSQEILEILRGMVEESPVLSRLRDKTKKDTQSTFHLKVPFFNEYGEIEYSYVGIKVGAASKKTTRGRAVCTLLADEACWWNLDENSSEPDVEVFRAIRPSLLQFGEHGTIIKLSSPAIKAGVMYEEWKRKAELQDEFIQLKAPSWMMNTILPKEEFKKEYKQDPDGFATEYRADFVDAISNFILPEFVDSCIVKGASFLPPADSRNTIYSAAIDAAFKGDRFAFALTGYNEKRVTLHVLKYWEGTKKDPVQAFEVAAYIRNVCKEYGISQVVADQYAFQPLREIFAQFGVTLVENTFSLPYKRKIYFGLKRLIHSNQIDLLDEPLLAKEIKELQVEQTATGQIRIGHPMGGNDDLSDAVAVAAYVSMEKAGSVHMMVGEVAAGQDYGIVTDVKGTAFTAPSVELLHNFPGFTGAMDNSHEYAKDPKTGRIMKKTEIDELEDLGTDGPNFIF